VSAKGVKDGITKNLVLDMEILKNQLAETEKDTTLGALTVSSSNGDSRSVSLLRARSANGDHAKGAIKCSKLIRDSKKRDFDAMSGEEKAAMTPAELKLAQDFAITNCKTHNCNLLGEQWIGKPVKAGRVGHVDVSNRNEERIQSQHGIAEFAVQKMIVGVPLLLRWCEIGLGRKLFAGDEYFMDSRTWKADVDGTCVLSDTTKPLKHDTRITAVFDGIVLPVVLDGMLQKPSVAEWNLLKCGMQRWRVWRTEGVKNPNPAPFHPDDVPSVSGGMMAVSKLFGPGGDHHCYYLNEADILAEFHEQVDADDTLSKLCNILPYKGSRQNWFIENAVPVLLLSQRMVRCLHQLLVCVPIPNDLVVAALRYLSDQSAMGCLAGRAVLSVEFITVNRMLVKSVLVEKDGGRWKTTKLKDLLILSLQSGLERGKLIKMAADAWPKYAPVIMRWFRFQKPLVEAVYKATVPFESEISVIVPRCSPKVIAKIIELHDGDFDGDPTMFHAFVTNDFEESSFGCLKDMHRQSNKIRKVSNITGPASCRMNGTFSTIEQMLRLEQKARGNRREDKMTKEEMVQFCEVPSIAAFDSCSADKQKETYDKYRRDAYKNQVTDPNNKLRVQIVETFGRRVAKRDGHEASMSETLKQFLAHEIMPVFTSMAMLDAEFSAVHLSSEKPKYSIANKVRSCCQSHSHTHSHCHHQRLPSPPSTSGRNAKTTNKHQAVRVWTQADPWMPTL
jgi:hypothetical protein